MKAVTATTSANERNMVHLLKAFGKSPSWPITVSKAMQAVKGLFEGERELWRVDAMIEKTFRLRMLGDRTAEQHRLGGSFAQTLGRSGHG